MFRKSTKVNRPSSDQWLERILIIFMLFIAAIMLYPLLVVLSTSCSSPSAVTSGKVWLFPVDFSLEGYKAVFKTSDVLIGYRNSLFYMVVGTTLNVCMTLLAAYPLSRDDLVGRGIIMKLFTFTMIFSGGMIPNYLLLKDLNMLNTRWAMILPGAISA